MDCCNCPKLDCPARIASDFQAIHEAEFLELADKVVPVLMEHIQALITGPIPVLDIDTLGQLVVNATKIGYAMGRLYQTVPKVFEEAK